MADSPIQQIIFNKITFHLKRDDLLSTDFSGNKARKFHYLLTRDFQHITAIHSYGSLQSNAMASLSVLAKMRGWRFYYYTRANDSFEPKGNLAKALANGMIMRDIQEWPWERELMSQLIVKETDLYIPEGGRFPEARKGIEILAKELLEWGVDGKRVFLPSGTGTTALYLQKALFGKAEVATVPCVGDEEYLKKQFASLEPDAKYWPNVLNPPKKYRFGRLYKELFGLWEELCRQSGVEFDLLYDPVGFATLIYHGLLDGDLLYVHQGGILGNETMLERYKQKLDKIAQTKQG